MTFAMQEILRSKRALRERLAARPYAEKLRLLEQLRERSLAIAAMSSSNKDRVKVESGDAPQT
jgi:hypothetical protein